jgi:hypothetical protein
MVLFGDILEEVIRAMRASQNPEEQARILRRLNQDLFALALMDSWADLRKKQTISWTGTAVQLPSNLVGIDLVWDDVNEIQYHARNVSAAEQYENMYRYMLSPVGDALLTAEDVSVEQDSTTLTSTTLAASGSTLVGEFLVLNGEPQVYKITAHNSGNFTIYPAYRGRGDKQQVSATVRPPGTQQVELTAPGNSEAPSGSIDIYYWQLPTMLRDDNDVVPFPTADVLTFRSLSRLPEAKARRPISQTQVQEALDEALSLNPDKPLPRVAKDLQGNRMDFSRNAYSPMPSGRGFTRHGVYDIWQRNRI